MSKNDPKSTVFHKYDVEASIDEIENTETSSVFKYGFTILSNPKNVRLTIEGVSKITGDAKEREDTLAKDENQVPKILSVIYQELFPTFFLLSKSLNVSCPPIQIGGIGASSTSSEISSDVESEFNNVEFASDQEDITNQEDSEQRLDELVENKEIIQPKA